MKIKIICEKDRVDELVKEIKAGQIEFVEDGEDFILSQSNFKKNSLIGVINNDYLIVKPDDIIYVESFGNETFCHTVKENYIIRERLYEIEGLFNENGLIRIHKSYVINTNRIKKISPGLDRKFVLTMEDGTKIDVTRSYFHKFKEYIGL